MATQFISRVERQTFSANDAERVAHPGPGHYSDSPPKTVLPNFHSFGQTQRRSDFESGQKWLGPPPTKYDTSGSLLLKSLPATFKSQSKRFAEDREALSKPAPGAYSTHSMFTAKKSPADGRNRPSQSVETLSRILESLQNVPSIPAKNQTYGYDTSGPEDGSGGGSRLTLQLPAYPIGFSGEGADRVGPLDYDPRLPSSTSGPSFGKSASSKPRRTASLPMMRGSAATATPTAGYEDFQKERDAYQQARDSYAIAVNAARLRKQSSSFQSRVRRDFMSAAERQRMALPGPGDYSLPSAFSSKQEQRGSNSFLSSERRFKEAEEGVGGDGAPPPGAYDPLTSDFDRNKRLIYRRNQTLRRAGGWTKGISFSSTDARFADSRPPEDEGGEPVVQFPTDMAYQAQRLRATSKSSFGLGAERFVPSRQERPARLEPKDLFELGLPPPRRSVPVQPRPRYTHVFASGDPRFRTAGRPTPGPMAYQLPSVWRSEHGALPMAPVGQSPVITQKGRRDPAPGPGPGQYEVGTSLVSPSKRSGKKRVMLSTAARFKADTLADGPPPGAYQTSGDLLKPSFNVLLNEHSSALKV